MYYQCMAARSAIGSFWKYIFFFLFSLCSNFPIEKSWRSVFYVCFCYKQKIHLSIFAVDFIYCFSFWKCILGGEMLFIDWLSLSFCFYVFVFCWFSFLFPLLFVCFISSLRLSKSSFSYIFHSKCTNCCWCGGDLFLCFVCVCVCVSVGTLILVSCFASIRLFNSYDPLWKLDCIAIVWLVLMDGWKEKRHCTDDAMTLPL